MITIYGTLGYDVISRSKNLRGVISHAGKHGLNVVRLYGAIGDQSYTVKFWFNDRASAETTFADWRVLLDWLCTRNRAPNRLTLPEAIWHKANDEGRLARIRQRGTVITMA